MKHNYTLFTIIFYLVVVIHPKSVAQCTFTSNVPYSQTFSTINTASPLPACWARSSTVNCVTFPNSTQAGFYYIPAATSYFWSNGVYLNAGITYSTSIFYSTTNNLYTNWSGLALLLGTSQTTTGLSPIVVTSPAISVGYSTLSGTFTVATSGIYYIAIRGISSGACCSTYLYFDDLSVTIPCSLNPLTVSIASPTSICAGDVFTLAAQGADTYTWNTGSNATSFTTMPGTSIGYAVSGTSTLTGCVNSASVTIAVNPKPILTIVSSTNTVCEGNSVNLTALGGGTVIWSNGSNNTSILVSPTITATYTLTGWNNFNCYSTASTQINVLPAPLITTTLTKNPICFDELATIYASGANTYTWSSPIASAGSATIQYLATAHTVFTIAATGVNGCIGTTSLAVNLSRCNSIDKEDLGNGILIYPNPINKNSFTIATNGFEIERVEIYDVTGRRLFFDTPRKTLFTINTESFTQGVYYLQVNNSTKRLTQKVIIE